MDHAGGLYPQSYGACRAAFVQAAQQAGAVLDDQPIAAPGPGGEALSIATAWLGEPHAAKVLALQCGVHGVEGPPGSAVMVAALEEGVLADAVRQCGIGVLLVHAANPFGFAWRRRQTEGNVDLNRNFLDWSAPVPDRAVYATLDPLLNPVGRAVPDDSAFLAEAAALMARHGLPWIQARVSEGQYGWPQGLYYGGAAPVAANGLLRAIWRRYLGRARHVMQIDFHTGLGVRGSWTALSAHAPGTPAHHRLVQAFGPRQVEATIPATGGDSARYPHVSGRLAEALVAALPEAAVTACSLEFGTVDEVTAIRAERLENWQWHHGTLDPADASGAAAAEAIIAHHAACFSPPDPDWQAAALTGGRTVIGLALASLAGSRTEDDINPVGLAAVHNHQSVPGLLE
jgi:hypothetical protein